MDNRAKWIWLSDKVYPEYQFGEISYFSDDRKKNKYILADFIKKSSFGKKIISADIDISADVRYRLYINGEYIGTGPVCPGGDYANTKPMPYHYYSSYSAKINSDCFDIYVQVQKNIVTQCDMSQGRAGLIFSASLHFDDGSRETIISDESWLCRINTHHTAPKMLDMTIAEESFCNAQFTGDNRNLQKSQIKNLAEEFISPKDFKRIAVTGGESKVVEYEYEKIISGYYNINITASDSYTVTIKSCEKAGTFPKDTDEFIIGNADMSFRSFEMHSVGTVSVTIENTGNSDLYIDDFGIYFTHYPKNIISGSFSCSDENLNKIYEMGRHALTICRQSIELDSPKHQENLGCTGDYFISSLMNYYTDGDTQLSRFDILRTAHYLEMTDGYMFHTTYSLIWVLMLYDNYMVSGDTEILHLCNKALKKLLKRFDSFVDERGIISSPPNYMFVDWLMVDGHNIHHPPMALGQSVLNAFYAGALKTAVSIFKIIGDSENEEKYSAILSKLKDAFNKYFYDENKGLYFDGLNESYEENEWLPTNTEKRYFSIHTNALAVLYDIAPHTESQRIMDAALSDDTLIQAQPYFMHFVLEAIYKSGNFAKHGIRQLRRWDCMLDFPKGLQEGWYKPTKDYCFDYSHVWGGTPTYQLPSKLSGLEIIEPGFKKIRLNPSLFGLDYADIQIPTGFGLIKINMKKNQEPIISVPDGITLIKD